MIVYRRSSTYAAKSFAGPLGIAGRTLTPQGNPSDLAGLEEMSTDLLEA